MIYNSNTLNSLQRKSTINAAVQETNTAIKKISGSGLLRIIKKILYIFPLFKNSQDRKIAQIYENCFFQLEVIRDNFLLQDKSITLTSNESVLLQNLLDKVERFAKKKIYNHLNIYHTAVESTILKKNTPPRPYAITEHQICKWSRTRARISMRDPIAKFINDPLFDPQKYFEKLRSLPAKERINYWDDLSNLNVGVSTKYIKEVILPDIKHDKDKKYIYSLIEQREQFVTSDSSWNDAIDQMEIEYSECLIKQQEAHNEGIKLWQTLQKDLPHYLHLLDDKKINDDFQDWVIRDRQSPHVFFQSRACVQLMKEFAISDHLATCEDTLHLDEKRVPHIFQEGKGQVPWTRIPWDEIFIANEYIRMDIDIIDKKIGSNKKRNLYYMPKRGLIKHEVLNNNIDDFKNLPSFRYQTISLNDNENPQADISPVISYESNSPTVADTHVYIELRIPHGDVFIENGVRKVQMKIYPFGVGHDTKIRHSKRKKIFYFLTTVLPNAMKVDPIELFMPDQNEFYRTRKFTKLNEPIKLNKNELNEIILVLQSFQRSSQNLSYTGPDKKIFQASLSNCTQLPTQIYKKINKQPLPKTMPLHHCLKPGIGKNIVKFIHQGLPSFLRKIVMETLGIITGAKGKLRQKDFHINTTWLQRLTIELINENNRFKHVLIK